MNKLKGISFKGYKSFSSDEYNSLDEIKNMNVIIGKNNCGKSSVIDILEYIIDFDKFKQNKNNINRIDVGFLITEKNISISFPNNIYNPYLNTRTPYEFGQQFIGKVINLNVISRGNGRDFVYAGNQDLFFKNYEHSKSYIDILAKTYRTFFDNYKFRRLNAERDILPEHENSSDNYKNINTSGRGATEIIRSFKIDSSRDDKFIDKILLNGLNIIINPESIYSEITVKNIGNNNFEIYLKEENGETYPLSKCGSGLKTIILVLLNLLIIPKTDDYKDKRIVFAFEELENNLHPALQRRLFKFIYDYAVEKDISIFLTTHSHVAINFFSSKDKADHSQIFHVVKDENISSIQIVNNYIDKIKILEDLDVRASDLFQSNGIIWVEGPSDRVYIKKWLEIFCDCKYEENNHYQFLYYGGKLLYHFTAENEIKDLINILTTNHNSAIVIDSDKKSKNAKINDTKKRIRTEFENNNLFCWITKGKEIENYLPVDAIKLAFTRNNIKQCKQYELFPDYISKIDKNFKKVNFANKLKDYINKDNVDILDLKEKIESLYKQIQKWNNDLEKNNE